jgi:YVTN family beta-propeller protein
VDTRSVSISTPSTLTWLYPAALAASNAPCRLGARGGEDIDALVPIVVAGRLTDRVVPGQLTHPGGAVQEPPQHQHRLIVHRQRAGVGAGTPPEAFGRQQTGQEVHISSTVSLGTVGTDPFTAAATSHAVYVTDQGDNTLSVIDPHTLHVVRTIAIGNSPYGIAVTPSRSNR